MIPATATGVVYAMSVALFNVFKEYNLRSGSITAQPDHPWR